MREAQCAEGFDWKPRADLIFVADLGQPDQVESGLYLGNGPEFGIYRFDIWRYGEVIAIGPGRYGKKGHPIPMPDIKIGDIIMFSRKHGTRLPGDVRYKHPGYPEAKDGLLVRVLDPEKTVAVLEDFKPWWNVANRQIDPNVMFSG